MSREELELVTRAMRAVSARPKPDFATMNEVFHPDHVFVPVFGQIEGAEYHGARGSQEFFREVLPSPDTKTSDAAMSGESDFEGAIDVGNHKVIAVHTGRYRGTASGVEVEQRLWTVMTVRNGRISRSEVFHDPTDALRAALSEQDAHADA
jgi:ketosteroid isomerase-like protein